MKVLALVFAVALVALMVGAFSPVAAPECGGSCSECARDGPGQGSPAQCMQFCLENGCPQEPSEAICYHNVCEM